jgi:hypothetical protein
MTAIISLQNSSVQTLVEPIATKLTMRLVTKFFSSINVNARSVCVVMCGAYSNDWIHKPTEEIYMIQDLILLLLKSCAKR